MSGDGSTGAIRSRETIRSGGTGRPIVNTHVHLPPNFSAFETAEDAVETAAAEGVRVLGASNFHDRRIYGRFAEAAVAAGMPRSNVRYFATSDEAAEATVAIARAGDVVLVKGSRGVKTDRVVDRLKAERA